MPKLLCWVAVKYKAVAAILVMIAVILYIAFRQLHNLLIFAPGKMIDNKKFIIGGITISVEGDSEDIGFNIPSAYLPFVGNGNIKSDICLQLHDGDPPPAPETKAFACPPIWSLYRDNGASVIKISEHTPGFGRTLFLSQDAVDADLYFDDPCGSHSDPFYGPTMELLMINFLAQDRGIIIHGCGIKYNDLGILFVGESGAGKTTMANMWSPESDVEVLSDDRTIVRKLGDHFVMYGTPWHGEGKFGSPDSVKLDQIFFIEQGQTISILKCKKAHSVTQFLKCSFPPFWDAAGMEYSMGVFSDLAAAVPCRMLSFVPDSSIIGFVGSLL